MEALHFGAGNIGRGFIGLILRENGYAVTFADISDVLIDALKEKKAYDVFIADEQKKTLHVDGVDGVHSGKEPERLAELIVAADLITTAVGVSIIPIVARTLVPGIRARLEKEDQKPLNIIACENAIGATEILREELFKLLDAHEVEKAEKHFGFPNSAVDRIVPMQTNENPLDVMVEPFFEWVVDAGKLKGDQSPLEGVHYVENLIPYIERKLFTVNTGHAATAYIGIQEGHATVYDAIMDANVESAVRGVLEETTAYIVQHHGFDEKVHRAYVDTILQRFKNPNLSDDLDRVARSPIRKIGKEDRFVNPALQLLSLGILPRNLAKVIAYALKFRSENDPESLELHDYVMVHGVRETLLRFSGLEPDNALIPLVEEAYGK